jgi:hypothetical protein
VTIIAGFQCTDGILMCSDTERSLSADSKSQVNKVPHFQLGKLTTAIGGSGDGPLIDYVTQDLVRHLAKESYDWKTIEAGLNSYAQETFSKHIRPYAGLPRDFIPDVSFLIAIGMEGQARLFKWERNFAYVVPLMRHMSIGIGVLQSEQLLSEIQFYYPYRRMLFFAVRMMQQVKQLVQGCGGKTEAVFLATNGELVIQPGIFVIDEIEHITLMVDEFFTNHALSFIANTSSLDKKSVDDELDMLRQGIGNLREKYRECTPGVFIKKTEP